MIIPVKTNTGGYPIYLERGALKHAGEYLRLDRKVLIVSDDGVPAQYAEAVKEQCREAVVECIPQGEASKSLQSFQRLLFVLTHEGFTRTDCVVAVGGGMIGDLAGFAAASYMRGIDFYNIPTTVLSQVDSSIGGKVAVDFEGYKNIVGAFYPPKAVIIDPETLRTLSPRQISNGLAEAVKMALTSDRELFRIFEENDITLDNIDEVIHRALLIKKSVVEQDEKEAGLRKILNFGHTLAHAIEADSHLRELYHGECVAIGMLPMCSPEIRPRVERVLKKLSLPTHYDCGGTLSEALAHDKKLSGRDITVVLVKEIGSFEMKTVPLDELEEMLR